MLVGLCRWIHLASGHISVLGLVLYKFSIKNFTYFSGYVIFYCAEICSPTAYFTSSWCVLKRGFQKLGLFFQDARLVFVAVNTHPQLLQIFGHTDYGRFKEPLWKITSKTVFR